MSHFYKSKTQEALDRVRQKHGLAKATTDNTKSETKSDKGKQNNSAPSAPTNEKARITNQSQIALERVRQEHGLSEKTFIVGKSNGNTKSVDASEGFKGTYTPKTTTTKPSGTTKKYTDYNTETKNAYSKTKSYAKGLTTIASDLSEEERKKRIKEIKAELSTYSTKLTGYSRAKVYGANKALLDAEKRDKERMAELSAELKALERTGTFTASELKQFEIDDAKAKVASANAKVNAYGQRPSGNEVEGWKNAVSERYNAQQELDEIKRQKTLYDDINEFGDVVNGDNFSGQWRANYRSNELSREADKAMSRYIDNPTEENREIAYAYDALAREYAENNKYALDDKNVKASWLTKSMAGYLPQFKDQIVPELVGGGVGLLLGSAVGAPNVGMSVGSGIGTFTQSYNVMRGSVYRTLLAEGVDEETALQAAKDEALISSLIESGETALSVLLAGGSKAIGAISGAAKASVAKGSTNAATKFVANLATNRAASKAAKAATRPLWRKAIRAVGGVALQGGSEYLEEFTQGAASKANREQALATVDKEIGQYGEGNIDLHNRPIYKNTDGSISTVDSVTFQIDDKFVVLPTIVRDENGKAKRLEEDEEIFAHYAETGEHLGKFDTLEEANAYAYKLHTAQAYYYSDKTVSPDDNLLVGGAKVIGDAVFGGNTETLSELHEQGVEGFKIGLMFGGTNATVNNIVTHYANAKTVKAQNEIADALVKDEKSLKTLVEECKASGEGTVSAKIATEIETAQKNGKEVTRNQVKQLIESNKVYIEEEQKTAEPTTEEAETKTIEEAESKAIEAAFEAGRQNVPREKLTLATLEQEEAYNNGRIEHIKNMPKETPKSTGEITDRTKTVLGGGETSVGIVDGQAYVTNSNDINPSPTNRSVFLPVNDANVAKTELGATESNKTGANVGKILASDFTPVRENYVDGNLKDVGEVRVFTDENGREIALEKDVAEYFEGYNLEATFRGGKPYAIKATDNDGNVAGVAMAIWTDKSGQTYDISYDKTVTKPNTPYNVMSNENPLMQERKAREAYIQKSTGFDKYGVQAFTDIMETVTESEAPVVAKAFRTAYEYGRTNVNESEANLMTDVHRIAFNAGKQDFIMDNARKVENVKNVKSHGDKAGLDSANVPSNVSKQAIDIVNRFYKELGVVGRVIGESDMYNANITPNVGVVQIASNFDVLKNLGDDAASKSFVLHALHEAADHRAEELAPTEYAEFKREMYNYKNSLDGVSLADAKRQAYGNKGVDISLSEAMSEVTANSLLELYDNDLNLLAKGLDRVLKGTNAKAKKGANIFKQALDYVIEKFNKFLEKLGLETRKSYGASLDEVIKVRDAFEKTLAAAIVKNREIAKSSNLVTEKNGTIVDAKGNVIAQINEDGTATFSLKTFDDSGRAELKKWLDKNVKSKKITEAEAKDISEQLEYYYDICKQYEDKYAPFSAWSKAEVVKGLDGKPLMSVVKANGDYKMNLDFSLVCKKRRPLDALYRAMIDDGFMDDIGQLSEVEVARINEIIRKNGFETACTLCFVDSKRYRQYAVADSFVSKYNELVKMLAPEGAKIDRFDFSGKREASADGLHTMSNADLKSGINKLNKVIKEQGESTVVGKIAKHLKAVPQDRKLVMVSDFMDSEGFVRVKKANPEVFKLYNSSKGSGGPKATLPDVQYLGEILKRANFTPKKAYAVGGVRVQSFSDYIPRLVFDYLQMTADLSAKKLPAHAYSKEDIFVMQFGKTGIKINMSLVPAVAKDGIAPGLDKDGNYVWVDGHTFASDFHDKGSGQRGFELAVKIQNTEGYAQNCGTIAVGVSDEHIIKMLKDNDIRMVIPYHKSSLNHFVAQMGNIDQYKDYTNVQNTRDRATGKKIEGKDFNFNEAFHRLGDAKAATNEYLAWCEKNNYIPKFDTFAFHEDAQVRENYYKVLIDFAAYDSEGNAIPQGAVTMNFPTENDAFGSMKSLIEKGLEADAILEGRKASDIPKILEEVKSVLGTATEGKKFSLKDTNSLNNLEIKTNEEYNGNKRYSLKWRTDLNGAEYRQVEKWIRQSGNPEATRITDTANWYKGRINGESLFVIYSTEDINNPTILYEAKGGKARVELDILTELLEEIENGKSNDGKSAYVNWVSGGGWMQKVNNSQNNLGNMGSGQNNQNVGVLQSQSRRNGSPAFWSVLENLFDIQEESEKVKSYSLKGTEHDISLKDVPKVRKAVADKNAEVLAKYVESGAISTDVYNQLIEEFGAIPTGENPYRDVSVPSKTAKDKKVSQTVRTVLEAEATPDEAVPTIQKMVEDGVFSYDVYTDKEAIENGEDYIKTHGWQESLLDWFEAVNSGEVSKDLTTTGWILYNHAATEAATATDADARKEAAKTAARILDAMVRHQRSAAQALQATRILKKLSPETQLYGIQKSVSALQNELKNKYGKKAPDLKIDEDLAEQFINAKTPEERAAVEEELYKDIGRQMPSDWLDMWNAWRYLAMLGNPRTHIRNIVGNAGFAPIIAAKNLTATAIESIVYRVSGKRTVRGKALITGSKADRALLKAAWGDYGNVADMISNGGRYNDSAMGNKYIQEGRAIFTSKYRLLRGALKPLEVARKGNSTLLEVEDMWFSKPHYAYALAQYCKAHNITAEQIQRGKAIAPAREYAIKEAQKATYRDTNALSQFVSGLGRNGKANNWVEKAGRTVIEGVLPFRKTPANILVRGIEYSPLGLLKGLSYDLYQVGKGNMTATEAIDNISAGLTGTGLLALGWFLAAQGIIRGHGGEDKEEKEFKELMGHQDYSLELPSGQSVTLDWLAPESLPFFTGVNLWETTKGTNEETNLAAILSAVSNISDPMLEMSFLQGLNDAFESVGYAKSNDTSAVVAVLSSAVTSYLTQGIPTLFGQVERTSEEERMTTYTEKNGFLTGDVQYTLGKASAKIPFWDYNQIPYIDAWGRQEASGSALKRGLNNFLNPAYTSTIETSSMENELLRLYESTGEGGVFPERADKYFTVDGVRKDLTADEYVRYATLKGQKSYNLVTNLVKSKAFKKLSDEEKVKAIKETYDYANQKAKEAISRYEPDTWVKKADEFGSNVGNYISFKTEVSSTKQENEGKISKQEVADIILDMAQNDSETWKMYLTMYDSTGDMYAYDKGIEGEDYMNFLKSLSEVDKPTKSGKYGTYTQEEVTKAVKRIDGLTRKEKADLWQSVNTNWKKNPFR